MRFWLVVGCAVCLAAVSGCDKSFHLVLRNDTGQPVNASLGSETKPIAAGGSADFVLRGDRRLRVQVGSARWDYGRSWVSADFSSFNPGDYRYVRSAGFFGPSTVNAVLRADGRILVRAVVDRNVTDRLADPQPEGYPLTPGNSTGS